MATRKKSVTKKQAAEGRGVLCRTCCVRMGVQLTIEGGKDYVCPKCGRRWQLEKPVSSTIIIPSA